MFIVVESRFKSQESRQKPFRFVISSEKLCYRKICARPIRIHIARASFLLVPHRIGTFYFSIIIHCAITLACVCTIINGVPFGTHIAWLSSNKTGIPITSTLTDAVTHWAVTHGTGAPATTNGHPATT
jgi:hypothetical protein